MPKTVGVAALARRQDRRAAGIGYMPAFRPTELSDDDVAAIGAYLARKKRRRRGLAMRDDRCFRQPL